MPVKNESYLDAISKEILRSTPMLELRSRVRPARILQSTLKQHQPIKASAALLVYKGNAGLPANEHIDVNVTSDKVSGGSPIVQRSNKNDPGGVMAAITENPLNAIQSLPPLFKGYSEADLLSLYFIPLFLDRLMIGILSSVEFGLRILGASITYPGHLLYKLINDKIEDPILRGVLQISRFILNSPLWCISQTLTLAADACVYTKQLIDSAVHIVKLVNPLWWIAKWIGKEDSKAPSVNLVLNTFVKSVVNLIPTAAIVLTAVFTAGISVPFLNAMAGPLNAAGAAIMNTVLAPAAIATKVVLGVFIAGAVSTVGKLFSAVCQGCVKGVDNVRNARAEEKAKRNKSPIKQREKGQRHEIKNDKPDDSPKQKHSQSHSHNSETGIFQSLHITPEISTLNNALDNSDHFSSSLSSPTLRAASISELEQDKEEGSKKDEGTKEDEGTKVENGSVFHHPH